MHIIEESKAEYSEMPQDWTKCDHCYNGSNQSHKSAMCCLKCGTILDNKARGGIKEPRFMKDTHHLDPYDLFKQM